MDLPARDRWEEYKEQVIAGLVGTRFSRVYGVIARAKPSGNGYMLGRCPFHDDKHPSFGYSTETGQWSCFAGCGQGSVFDFEMRRSGRPFGEVLLSLGDSLALPRPSSNGDGHAIHDYRDESGALLFQVVRGAGKKFSQRRPDGQGGFIRNLTGVRRVLYRLPDLLARPGERVFVVEGEKDVESLRVAGLLATTNPGGAGKWRDEYNAHLQGRDVVILPDNDAAGRDHAAKVASALAGLAATVRVVELPGLPEKGDISDWLAMGHGVTDLHALVEQARPLGLDAPISRPPIRVTERQLSEIIEEAWGVLLAAQTELRLFRFAGAMARITETDAGLTPMLLTEDQVYGLLLRRADWLAKGRNGLKDAKPPREVAKDMLAFPNPALPVLEAIVTSPVFTADGRLLTEPGYDPGSGLWYEPHAGFTLPPVSTQPSEADVQQAVSLLTEDLLVDFPFSAESDEAHALAGLILPFARRLFRGCSPIHGVESPTPGSGKGLLSDLVSIVARGRPCEATTLPSSENDARKKITAILSRSPQIILIDNVRGELKSSELAAVLTAEVWTDRILGLSRMGDFPNRATWLLTANNPSLSAEIARRFIRVRLAPDQERPWERSGFKHDPIREWAMQERPRLVWAVLTLVQNWLAQGRPPGSRTLGSFDTWAKTIGGILACAGIRGFLEDTEEFYEAADIDGQQWRAFVEAWAGGLGDKWVTASDLLRIALREGLLDSVIGDNGEHSQRTRLGNALAGQRDRRFGGRRVLMKADPHSKSTRYRLAAVESELLNEESDDEGR